LFFNGVYFCQNVSEYRDKPTDLHHLVKLQEGVERRLGDMSGMDKGERDNPHSKVCDLVIDRLLL